MSEMYETLMKRQNNCIHDFINLRKCKQFCGKRNEIKEN